MPKWPNMLDGLKFYQTALLVTNRVPLSLTDLMRRVTPVCVTPRPHQLLSQALAPLSLTTFCKCFNTCVLLGTNQIPVIAATQ